MTHLTFNLFVINLKNFTLHHLYIPITNILRNYKCTEIVLMWHDFSVFFLN